MNKINIAIDGPSGVGKSTIADLLAEKLGMIHLDTGAMYRCVTFYMLQNKIDLNDSEELTKALNNIHISFDNGSVYLNQTNVSQEIRTNRISMATSKVATLPAVRKKMVTLQQKIAKDKGYILDGRDICSVVLPDAEIKIFMDASSKARAERRYKEYIQKGIEADYETIYQDIVARDYQDSHREISPLVQAEDAIRIDTSNANIEQVVEEVLNIINHA